MNCIHTEWMTSWCWWLSGKATPHFWPPRLLTQNLEVLHSITLSLSTAKRCLREEFWSDSSCNQTLLILQVTKLRANTAGLGGNSPKDPRITCTISVHVLCSYRRTAVDSKFICYRPWARQNILLISSWLTWPQSESCLYVSAHSSTNCLWYFSCILCAIFLCGSTVLTILIGALKSVWKQWDDLPTLISMSLL